MIELTFADLVVILRELPLSDEQVSQLEGQLRGGKFIVSDDLADTLRDVCSNELDTSGFDEKYGTNRRGEKLEKLIDKLFVG